jgi:hypothetical protein
VKPPASEILVPNILGSQSQVAETDQKHTAGIAAPAAVGCSSIVDRRSPPQTVQPHGMSRPELNRLAGAMRFMELGCARQRQRLWLAHINKGTPRALIADICKRITRLQGQLQMPKYWLAVFEGGTGRLHAHVTFIGNWDIARALQRSIAFGDVVEVEQVYDAHRLAHRYLAKERTPQAGYGRNHLLGGRIGGSHRLDGGGDRVRLSEQLEQDAIAAGQVEPWQHRNATRKAWRKTYRRRHLTRRALRLAGQLPLLPELDRPVSRLHEFGAGFVPPAVALELEFRRKQLGLSQTQFGARLGVSQGQYANAVRGHDPISAFAINRAREIQRWNAIDVR